MRSRWRYLGSLGAVALTGLALASTAPAQNRKIASLAFSGDGVGLAAAIEAGPVRVWAAGSGRSLGKLEFPRASDAIALSQEGLLLATAAPGGSIRVTKLNAADDPPVMLAIGGIPSAIRFSTDGELVAAASGKRVTLSRLTDRTLIGKFDVDGPIVGVDFQKTEDGPFLMAMSARGLVVMCAVPEMKNCTKIKVSQLDAANGEPRTPSGGGAIVQAQFFADRADPGLPLVAYLESGGRAVVAELTLFAFRNRVTQPYATGPSSGGNPPHAIVVAPDGRLLVAATAGGAYVVDRAKAYPQNVTLPAASAITSMAYSRSLCALGLADGTVQLLAHPAMFVYAQGSASGDLSLAHPASAAPDPLAPPAPAVAATIERARQSLMEDPQTSLELALGLADDDAAAGRPLSAATEQMLHAGIIWSKARYRSAEQRAVKMVRVSRDGRWIATLAVDGSIAIRTSDGVFVRRARPARGAVAAIEWAGDHLIAATSTGDLSRYNPVTWAVERAGERSRAGLSFLRASHDGKHIAVSANDGMHVVDAATLEDVGAVPRTGSASLANWSNNDKELLVTAGRAAFVWDLDRAAESSRIEAPFEIHLASWYGGEDRLVALSDGGADVTVWKPGSGSPVSVVHGVGGHVVSAAWAAGGWFDRGGPSFSRGPRLAVADSAGHVVVWYADRNPPVAQTRFAVQRDGVDCLDWHPEGDRIVTADGKGVVTVWHAGDSKEEVDWRPRMSAGVLGWSADSQALLASGSSKDTVITWDMRTDNWIWRSVSGHQAIAGEWSPDGSRIAAVGSGLFVWDARSDKREPTLVRTPQTGPLWGIAWSPNSPRIAIGGQDTIVRVVDADTGEEDVFARGHRAAITAVAWSPDGRQIASASLDWTVRIWNSHAHTPHSSMTLMGHQGAVLGVAWSPDGSHIASVDVAGVLKLWDAGSGRELASVAASTRPLRHVTYSPDGRLLAAISDDGSFRVWDAKGRERVEFTPSASVPAAVSWSRDGKRLAVGYEAPDADVRVFEIDPTRLLDLARRRLIAIVPTP